MTATLAGALDYSHCSGSFRHLLAPVCTEVLDFVNSVEYYPRTMQDEKEIELNYASSRYHADSRSVEHLPEFAKEQSAAFLRQRKKTETRLHGGIMETDDGELYLMVIGGPFREPSMCFNALAEFVGRRDEVLADRDRLRSKAAGGK